MDIRNVPVDQVADFYNKFILEYFPDDEVKPLNNIIRMMEDGLYFVIGLYEDGQAKGCAFVTSFPGGKSYLLDYLAVDKTARKQGYGGVLLKEVGRVCDNVGPVLIETESLESSQNEEEFRTREKRNSFYRANGAVMTELVTEIFGVEYNIWVLGTENYKSYSIDITSISVDMIGIYRYMVKESAYAANVKIPIIFNKIINGIEVKASYSEQSYRQIFLPLLERLTSMQRELGRRILIMLAAPPGAGKSTLCEFLQDISHRVDGLSKVQAIGMDGFHRYQDYLLSHTTLRDGQEIPMVKIKGAPITFDTALLKERIGKVKEGDKCGWPTYNRLSHNPQDNAIIVDSEIVILEGNYLLLNDEEWDDISAMADYTIRIEADPKDLYKRLLDRKINSGNTEAEAAEFVNYSDMVNVMTCLENSKTAQLNLLMKENGEYYDKQFV